MAGNSIGQIFRLTTFGESHGIAIGGVIDGCPAGLSLDLEQIRYELQRRKPGQSVITTQRKEDDEVEFLSGIFEGKTTGTSIGFIIRNTNQKSNNRKAAWIVYYTRGARLRQALLAGSPWVVIGSCIILEVPSFAWPVSLFL